MSIPNKITAINLIKKLLENQNPKTETYVELYE